MEFLGGVVKRREMIVQKTGTPLGRLRPGKGTVMVKGVLGVQTKIERTHAAPRTRLTTMDGPLSAAEMSDSCLFHVRVVHSPIFFFPSL